MTGGMGIAAAEGEGAVCAFPACGRPAHVRGLCIQHYRQQTQGYHLHPLGGPAVAVCRGCGTHFGVGRYMIRYCPECRRKRKREQTARAKRKAEHAAGRGRNCCTFAGCDRPTVAHGLCMTHYCQSRRGAELTPIHASRNVDCLACGTTFSTRRQRGGGLCPKCARQRTNAAAYRRRHPNARPFGEGRPCKDCGREIAWDIKSRSPRCPDCRAAYVRQWMREYHQRRKGAQP